MRLRVGITVGGQGRKCCHHGPGVGMSIYVMGVLREVWEQCVVVRVFLYSIHLFIHDQTLCGVLMGIFNCNPSETRGTDRYRTRLWWW